MTKEQIKEYIEKNKKKLIVDGVIIGTGIIGGIVLSKKYVLVPRKRDRANNVVAIWTDSMDWCNIIADFFDRQKNGSNSGGYISNKLDGDTFTKVMDAVVSTQKHSKYRALIQFYD